MTHCFPKVLLGVLSWQIHRSRDWCCCNIIVYYLFSYTETMVVVRIFIEAEVTRYRIYLFEGMFGWWVGRFGKVLFLHSNFLEEIELLYPLRIHSLLSFSIQILL